MPVMTADEFRSYLTSTYAEGTPQGDAFRALLGDANTNWQDLVFRTGISHDHNVSLYGNYDNILPYRASIGYTGQLGTLETSKYDRATIDLSLAPKFFKEHLTVSLNAKGVYNHQNYADSGAIGGAIGTISLGATVATMVAKGVASVALGLGIGVKTGMECEGSTGKRIATGITTGFFVAGGTFLGAQIDTSGFGFAGTAFTNFATTLFVGTPVEIMSVTAQQGISYTDSIISGGTSVPYLSFMSLSSKYSMATVG
jgi:hypothetical protein